MPWATGRSDLFPVPTALFDQPDLLRPFISSLLALLRTQRTNPVNEMSDQTVGHAIRALSQFGRRDELCEFLQTATEIVLPPGGLSALCALPPDNGWLPNLRVLVQIAGGRLILGEP